MTITVARILTELGNKAWSGFNKDDMTFDNEEAQQALTELNGALRYLINLEEFPFRCKEKSFTTLSNSPSYSNVDGQINCIYDSDNLTYLDYIQDNSGYDKTLTGTPSGYWIEYTNPTEKIRLYPIPDDKYSYKIVYNQYKPVMMTNKQTAFEFTSENDYLNLPSNLEYLFMDCLVLRVMCTNNKDQEDENYQPMINEFNEAWKVFIKACRPTKDTVFAIR